jgi:hypothetical protein
MLQCDRRAGQPIDRFRPELTVHAVPYCGGLRSSPVRMSTAITMRVTVAKPVSPARVEPTWCSCRWCCRAAARRTASRLRATGFHVAPQRDAGEGVDDDFRRLADGVARPRSPRCRSRRIGGTDPALTHHPVGRCGDARVAEINLCQLSRGLGGLQVRGKLDLLCVLHVAGSPPLLRRPTAAPVRRIVWPLHPLACSVRAMRVPSSLC